VKKNAKEYNITPGRSHAFRKEIFPMNLAELTEYFLS
jgi:hypothetical protein